MTWRQLNNLVPDPQCRTKDGVVTEWNDARPQPSQADIDAVLESDMIVVENQKREDNFDFDGVMVTIAKAFHNHENRIRALEGESSVTLKQVVKALRAL